MPEQAPQWLFCKSHNNEVKRKISLDGLCLCLSFTQTGKDTWEYLLMLFCFLNLWPNHEHCLEAVALTGKTYGYRFVFLSFVLEQHKQKHFFFKVPNMMLRKLASFCNKDKMAKNWGYPICNFPCNFPYYLVQCFMRFPQQNWQCLYKLPRLLSDDV